MIRRTMWNVRREARRDRDGHPLPVRGKLVVGALAAVGGIVYGVLGIVNQSISWTTRRRSFTGSGRQSLRFSGTEAQVFGTAVVVVCVGFLLVTHSYCRDDRRTRVVGFIAMAVGALGGVVGTWVT
jgi:uncharacterized membrane protein YfcA